MPSQSAQHSRLGKDQTCLFFLKIYSCHIRSRKNAQRRYKNICQECTLHFFLTRRYLPFTLLYFRRAVLRKNSKKSAKPKHGKAKAQRKQSKSTAKQKQKDGAESQAYKAVSGYVRKGYMFSESCMPKNGCRIVSHLPDIKGPSRYIHLCAVVLALIFEVIYF